MQTVAVIVVVVDVVLVVTIGVVAVSAAVEETNKSFCFLSL